MKAKKQYKGFLTIVLILIIGIAAIIAIYYLYYKKDETRTYKEAISLVQRGKYLEAKELASSLIVLKPSDINYQLLYIITLVNTNTSTTKITSYIIKMPKLKGKINAESKKLIKALLTMLTPSQVRQLIMKFPKELRTSKEMLALEVDYFYNHEDCVTLKDIILEAPTTNVTKEYFSKLMECFINTANKEDANMVLTKYANSFPLLANYYSAVILALSNPQKAYKKLKELEKNAKSLPKLYYYLAISAFKSKHYKEAEKYMEKFALSGENTFTTTTLKNLIRIYLVNKHYNKAYKLLKASNENMIDEDLVILYYITLIELGKYNEAANLIMKTKHKVHDKGISYFEFGMLKLKQSKLQEARNYFKKACDITQNKIIKKHACKMVSILK